MDKKEQLKILGVTDDEFREFIRRYDPSKFVLKFDGPDVGWTFKNYSELTLDEKQQHWEGFKKVYKNEDQAKEIYDMVLSRKSRPTSLFQIRQDLGHNFIIDPLVGECDESEIEEHQWKVLNARKEIKDIQAQMRMDEDLNELVFRKYKNIRHKFFEDLERMEALNQQSDYYKLLLQDEELRDLVEDPHFVTLDQINYLIRQESKQTRRRREKQRENRLQKSQARDFDESLDEYLDESWLDFVEDSRRTAKILPESKATRKLLRAARRKRKSRRAKKRFEFAQLEALQEELEEPLQEELEEPPADERLVVDGAKLLQDVINGHYTMEDISLAQNGFVAAGDPIEKSALQLFDNVVQYSRKYTRNILQSSDDPRQFFQSLQQSGIDIENMRPVQLDQCVESAATAIDLMSFTRTDPNEVMDACECLMKAQLMYEAEVNLKKVADISDWKRLQIHLYRKEQEEKIKKHDEAMAELGIRPTVDETLSKDSEQFKVAAAAEAKWLRDQENIATLHRMAYGHEQRRPGEDYDIYMKYDLSLLPSDDPNVYKPLEIISYIGLTRPNR